MNNERLELLKEVLRQQSESYQTKRFRKWITNVIRTNVSDVKTTVKDGSLYVTKGKVAEGSFYPCVVSHTDTVHDINPHASVHQQGDDLFAWCNKTKKQYGIGGDDKVGVFVCLMALIELPAVKCVFFRDEEVGCIGSSNADITFFTDCSFVLQCDRRGNSDFVNNIGGALQSKAFEDSVQPIIEQYGYKFSSGMMTDVEALADLKIGISVANMSCGYYEPHTNSEYVCISDVENCLNMVLDICEQLPHTRWEHTRTFKTYQSAFSGGWTGSATSNVYGDYYTKWKFDEDKGMYVQRAQTAWWKPADIHWMIDSSFTKGGFWIHEALLADKPSKSDLLESIEVVGNGHFSDPFRYYSPTPYGRTHGTTITVTDVATGETVSEKAKMKIANGTKSGKTCPHCKSIGGSYYDDLADDDFCLDCGKYHSTYVKKDKIV